MAIRLQYGVDPSLLLNLAYTTGSNRFRLSERDRAEAIAREEEAYRRSREPRYSSSGGYGGRGGGYGSGGKSGPAIRSSSDVFAQTAAEDAQYDAEQAELARFYRERDKKRADEFLQAGQQSVRDRQLANQQMARDEALAGYEAGQAQTRYAHEAEMNKAKVDAESAKYADTQARYEADRELKRETAMMQEQRRREEMMMKDARERERERNRYINQRQEDGVSPAKAAYEWRQMTGEIPPSTLPRDSPDDYNYRTAPQEQMDMEFQRQMIEIERSDRLTANQKNQAKEQLAKKASDQAYTPQPQPTPQQAVPPEMQRAMNLGLDPQTAAQIYQEWLAIQGKSEKDISANAGIETTIGSGSYI